MAFLTGVQGPAVLSYYSHFIMVANTAIGLEGSRVLSGSGRKARKVRNTGRAEKGGGRPHQDRKAVLLVLLLEKHQHICHEQHQHIWWGQRRRAVSLGASEQGFSHEDRPTPAFFLAPLPSAPSTCADLPRPHSYSSEMRGAKKDARVIR